MLKSHDHLTVGPPLFRINSCWEYKSKQIVDRGFILFGYSNSLKDFMNSYDRPYILKTETESETVSVFSRSLKDHDWISSLKNQRMIAVGLISFCALESAMRVSEKEQVSLEG
jgi:hypothetical protein